MARPDDPAGGPAPSHGTSFDVHATADVMRRVRSYADIRAAMVRRGGGSVPERYGRELVDDACIDTQLGEQPWDEQREALQDHLCRIIRRRTDRELWYARSLMSMDCAAADSGSPLRRRDSCGTHHIAAMLSTLCDELLRLLATDAKPDPRAEALVLCWRDGVIKSEELRERGFTEEEYELVRKRVIYRCRDLSPELRDSSADLLRRAS